MSPRRRIRRRLPPLPAGDPRVIADTKHNAETRMRGFDHASPVLRAVMTAVADPEIAQTMIVRFGVRTHEEAANLLARLGEARRAG